MSWSVAVPRVGVRPLASSRRALVRQWVLRGLRVGSRVQHAALRILDGWTLGDLEPGCRGSAKNWKSTTTTGF